MEQRNLDTLFDECANSDISSSLIYEIMGST